MSLYFVIPFILIFSSCTHTQKRQTSEVFKNTTKEELWLALEKAFKPYPLEEKNEDEGRIQTQVLQSNEIWTPPHVKNLKESKYRIKAWFYRDSRGDLNLNITKHIQQQKDFFQSSKSVPSDLLEEKMLMYRVKRELQILKMIKLHAKRSSSKN